MGLVHLEVLLVELFRVLHSEDQVNAWQLLRTKDGDSGLALSMIEENAVKILTLFKSWRRYLLT